eukprot:scaffold41159_cov57-Phaeocystis_antarctica.AAC.3
MSCACACACKGHRARRGSEPVGDLHADDYPELLWVGQVTCSSAVSSAVRYMPSHPGPRPSTSIDSPACRAATHCATKGLPSSRPSRMVGSHLASPNPTRLTQAPRGAPVGCRLAPAVRARKEAGLEELGSGQLECPGAGALLVALLRGYPVLADEVLAQRLGVRGGVEPAAVHLGVEREAGADGACPRRTRALEALMLPQREVGQPSAAPVSARRLDGRGERRELGAGSERPLLLDRHAADGAGRELSRVAALVADRVGVAALQEGRLHVRVAHRALQ